MARKPKSAPPPKSRDQEFLETAFRRFRLSQEAEAKMREEMVDDFEFYNGKQWAADIETARMTDSRPCLVMNRLPSFKRMVTNEYRQQRAAVQVNPIGGGADKETADVFQGIVRHIETNSDAEVAYDIAFDHMVIGGLGWFRDLTEGMGVYGDDGAEDKEILTKAIRNPFSVYDDPACNEPDRSDARFRFIVEDVPVEEFKAGMKPGSAWANSLTLEDFTARGNMPPDWVSKDGIRVAEYFYVEEGSKTIITLEDGREVDEVELKASEEIVPEKSRRTERTREVHWAKINALEIMEERKLDGKYIPVIPVIGEETFINGKRVIKGLIRDAKDPQRMYNYWLTCATETIALAPRAPWIAAEGQLENHEDEWAQSNRRNQAVLQYKPVSLNGTVVGEPKRQVTEPPIAAMAGMIRQADNDLKAITGIYDASLGQKGPEESGKAVLARQKQTDIAILNFSDNMARSIRHHARILLDLIPHVYDSPRVQRIIKPDQSVEHVGVFNSQKSGVSPDDVAAIKEMQQVKKIYDLGVGRYDVSVSVGPSYQSRRQEAAASMIALVNAFPPLMQAAGDLLLRNMDWPGADEIADRLKKMLPPQLMDDQGQDPAQQLQVAQAKLNMVMQQHEALTAALQKLQQIVDQKQVENQTKLDIARLQEETKILIAEITTKAQEAQLRIKMEQAVWSDIHGSSHEIALQKDQQAADAQQAQLAAQQAAQQQANQPQGAQQ